MSNERADIRSIEDIDRFRVSLVSFVEGGRAALMEAESDLDRTLVWLERDRVTHWKRQIRLRQELVARARSEVHRKQQQAAVTKGRVGDADERRRLRKAEERLAEAERRLGLTKRWMVQLERDKTRFKGAVSAFSSLVDHELPHAIGLLHRMSENLEAYLSMPPPELHRLLADDGRGGGPTGGSAPRAPLPASPRSPSTGADRAESAELDDEDSKNEETTPWE